ncbi:MAG: hypothetical protein QME77_11805 [bacterium]|nr:hypothetical protein [bacterium]
MIPRHPRHPHVPRHPDTIPGLAPDCRRVLRDAYLVIQARMERPEGCRPDAAAIAAAIEDYRRIAALWSELE